MVRCCTSETDICVHAVAASMKDQARVSYRSMPYGAAFGSLLSTFLARLTILAKFYQGRGTVIVVLGGRKWLPWPMPADSYRVVRLDGSLSNVMILFLLISYFFIFLVGREDRERTDV